MIRAYAPGDLDQVVAMMAKREAMRPTEIRERLDKWTSLVWEDAADRHGTAKGNAVRGFASFQREDDREMNLSIYVDPSARRAGIGSALYEAAISEIAALGHGRVTVRYRSDDEGGQAFFRKRGFVYWYSMDILSYDGPEMPDAILPSGVEILPYQGEHYEGFIRVMSESFIPQRRFFDFHPHDVRELHVTADDPERMLKNKDNMFVVTDQGRVVAVSELEDNFIDTLGVDLSCRGRGFGRALMQRCINVLRDRGYRVVETSVVLGNLPAWKLYNGLGFKRIQITEWACKWM